MKHKIIFTLLLTFLLIPAWGQRMLPFDGWANVERHSSDIVIARCLNTKGPQGSAFSDLIDSKIEIVKVLKGNTNLNSVPLRATAPLHPGEQYLIFAVPMDGTYNAIESYRVISLGNYVPPDLLKGKTMNENIRILFKWRLDILNRQMKEQEAEKQRLQEDLP